MKLNPSRADQWGTIREQGAQCLVNLRNAILTKTGDTHRYIQGPCWSGLLDTIGVSEKVGPPPQYLQIGTENTFNYIIVPMSEVVSIQPCNKVLRNTDVLVLK